KQDADLERIVGSRSQVSPYSQNQRRTHAKADPQNRPVDHPLHVHLDPAVTAARNVGAKTRVLVVFTAKCLYKSDRGNGAMDGGRQARLDLRRPGRGLRQDTAILSDCDEQKWRD